MTTLIIIVLVLVCAGLIVNGRRHCRLIREGQRPRK